MVSVPTENRPPPKPIKKAPARNKFGASKGAEKITSAKAGKPNKAPAAATRQASAPRYNNLAAIANATKAPAAVKAVNALVAPTSKCKIWPP